MASIEEISRWLPPLWLRLSVGGSFFLTMALVDLARRRREATRWREYTFLLWCILIAIVYGVINDQLTVTISPEYFAYGKGLAEILGPHFDQQPVRFRWEAAKVGIQATWAAGLIIGVVLLLANNPKPGRPSLPLLVLIGHLPVVLTGCIVAAAVLGFAGYEGLLARCIDDFAEMLRRDQFRPRRFMAVYGIHLGGYVGGLLGAMIAVVQVRRRRRNLETEKFEKPMPNMNHSAIRSGATSEPPAGS